MEKNSVITVDLDGTVTKFKEYLISEGKKFVGHDIVRTDLFGLAGMYNVSEEVEAEFWIKHAEDYYSNAEFKDNCCETLKWLMYKGHPIKFVTHRHPGIYCPMEFSRLKQITDYNLSKNGLVNSVVEYTDGNKSDVCLRIGSSYHIDDASSVMLDIHNNAKSVKTILMSDDWNRDLSGKCVYELDSWLDLKMNYDNIA